MNTINNIKDKNIKIKNKYELLLEKIYKEIIKKDNHFKYAKLKEDGIYYQTKEILKNRELHLDLLLLEYKYINNIINILNEINIDNNNKIKIKKGEIELAIRDNTKRFTIYNFMFLLYIKKEIDNIIRIKYRLGDDYIQLNLGSGLVFINKKDKKNKINKNDYNIVEIIKKDLNDNEDIKKNNNIIIEGFKQLIYKENIKESEIYNYLYYILMEL